LKDHSDAERTARCSTSDEPWRCVTQLPSGFVGLRHTASVPLAAMVDERRRFLRRPISSGSDAHLARRKNLERFVREICECEARWDAGASFKIRLHRIREQVGSDSLLLGLSGGRRFVRRRCGYCMDRRAAHLRVCRSWLLAKMNGDQVMQTFAQHMGVRVIRVNAEQRF